MNQEQTIKYQKKKLKNGNIIMMHTQIIILKFIPDLISLLMSRNESFILYIFL